MYNDEGIIVIGADHHNTLGVFKKSWRERYKLDTSIDF